MSGDTEENPTIAAHWEAFNLTAIDDATSLDERERYRTAFYCGAAVMFTIQNRLVRNGTDMTGEEIVTAGLAWKALGDELHEFRQSSKVRRL